MHGQKLSAISLSRSQRRLLLREGILYVRVLQPALHYELEQISKSEILRN
jgi:hypothetical protein